MGGREFRRNRADLQTGLYRGSGSNADTESHSISNPNTDSNTISYSDMHADTDFHTYAVSIPGSAAGTAHG